MQIHWLPDAIDQTNIASALRHLNLPDYSALHRWSVEHYPDFWRYVIEVLGIEFATKPSQICDLSSGFTSPRWFPHARLNIVDSCFKAPRHRVAIIEQDESGHRQEVTYPELEKLSNRVANGLVRAGYKPGDAIAVLLPMTAVAVAIYLGIIKAGCIAVGIAESFAVEEIKIRLELVNAQTIITCQDFIRGNKHFSLWKKASAAYAKPIIVFGQGTAVGRQQDVAWQTFMHETCDEFTSYKAQPDASVIVLFSSGTTGEPKAIPWDHTTPIKCASDAYFHHNVQPDDIIAWPTSLGWMMGPWLMFATLINGATMALYQGTPIEQGFGRFVQDNGITLLGLVPSLIKSWRKTPWIAQVNWHAIKRFSSTGECSNPDDVRYITQLAGNKPMIEYCGGTEIGGAYITSTMLHPAIAATFATPALGLDIVLIDEQGAEVQEGEVAIIGPSIGLSSRLLNRDHEQVYFAGMPVLASGTKLRRHGDRLVRLANGYYQALGRVDDTMNLAGIKVSAVEIEQVLNKLPQVQETAAIALSPQNGGPSELAIYVIASSGYTADAESYKHLMQQQLKQHLNPLFKIEHVFLVAHFPRTASNKLMRRLLSQIKS